MADFVDCCVKFLSCYFCTQCWINTCQNCCGPSYENKKTKKEQELEARYGPRANPVRNEVVPVAFRMDRLSLKL